MNDKYEGQDIEKLIFGGGLSSGAIEPSEKFWSKAYEDIFQRENRANLKRISRWRAGFYGVSAVALLMLLYGFYMHREVNGIQQQLTVIENTRVNTIQQNTSQNTVSTTTEKSTLSNKVASTSEGKNIQQTNKALSISSTNAKQTNTFTGKEKQRTSSKYHYFSGSIAEGVMPQNTNTPPSLSANTNQSNTPNSNSIIGRKNIDASLSGKISPSIDNPDSPQLTNTNLPAASPTQNSLIQNSKNAQMNKKEDSVSSVLDSANSTAYTPKKPITWAEILSKISISAFYAPGITDDFLNDKNNDPASAITANELKTHQDGDGTFAIGIKLAYDISDKWTIQTGCYYSEYSYNINPTVIHAQQQENGQVGYSIATSSGTVFLPNSNIPAHLGDSIQVKGSSSRGYISIPLQVKYKFAAGTKLSFYVDGGFSVNIANYEQTAIHWENTAFQEGDLSVKSIYGLSTIQYSYNLGTGAAYLIRRGLSIYIEPFVNGSVTSINKNTPVMIYPYFFGLSLGVTYHF